jgi:hypothetical protein
MEGTCEGKGEWLGEILNDVLSVAKTNKHRISHRFERGGLKSFCSARLRQATEARLTEKHT